MGVELEWGSLADGLLLRGVQMCVLKDRMYVWGF